MPRFRQRRYTAEEIRAAQDRLCADNRDLACPHNVWRSMADQPLVGPTILDVLLMPVIVLVCALILLGGAVGFVGFLW